MTIQNITKLRTYNNLEEYEKKLARLEIESLEPCDYYRLAYCSHFGLKRTDHYQLANYNFIKDDNKKYESYNNLRFRSSGYSVHGLYPYKGKSHPQIIRALLNIMKLRPDDLLIDPFAGSGTTNIEANLLGINSVAIDVSQVACYVIKGKIAALNNPKILICSKNDEKEIYSVFTKNSSLEEKKTYFFSENHYYYFLMAFLDALGYKERSAHPLDKLFSKIIRKYNQRLHNFIEFIEKRGSNIFFGKTTVLCEDSINGIREENNSVDGIITSPPYSFAIDYVENDKAQYKYLNIPYLDIKRRTVGLKGRTVDEKLKEYFSDLTLFLVESVRILKPQKKMAIIIGSNTYQTGGVDLVKSFLEISKQIKDLKLEFIMNKSILGIKNSMKTEKIIVLSKI